MKCTAWLTKLKRVNIPRLYSKFISLGALSQMRHYWAVLFGERSIFGFRKENMKEHPVELTYEEMQSMSMEDIKKFRDKSLKQLEKSLDEVAKKKKEEALKITEAIDTIAGTCIQLHTRLEHLERVIQQMAEDMGYEVQFKIDKEKLN